MAKNKDIDSISKTFATNVRKFRDSMAFTREELAEKSGLSPQNIARLESGERFVTVESLGRLSKAFGCEPHEFFISEKVQPANASLDKILRLLKNRSEKEVLFAHQVLALILKGP